MNSGTDSEYVHLTCGGMFSPIKFFIISSLNNGIENTLLMSLYIQYINSDNE